MDRHEIALVVAGVVGSAGAVVHGVLTQRYLVEPFQERAGGGGSPMVARIGAVLLQFSTFNWFVGGLALIVAACALGREARLAAGLLVGSSYLFAVLGNFWASQGRHPGWMLYAVALGLLAYGLAGPTL